MRKNPNKKAGEWGALNNKPINQVYFKAGGRVKLTAGGEKHVIYKKTTKRGEGKVGNIMVNHPTTDKGKWDTIDLTKKAKAKTVKQGVAATKKWHKENPYPDMKKKLIKKAMGGPGNKSKEVTKTPDGNYRIVTKTKDTPRKYKEVFKTRRTLKGVLSGASKYYDGETRPEPVIQPDTEGYMKKGGSVKKNKSTKKYTLGNPAKSLAKVGAIKKVKLVTKKKLISKSWLK